MRLFPWVMIGGFMVTIAGAIALIPSTPQPPMRSAAKPAAATARAPEASVARRSQSPAPRPAAGEEEPVRVTATLKPDMRTIHEGGPVGLMSYNAKYDTATFCDDSHWQNMGDLVRRVGKGEVLVRRSEWETKPTGTQVQLASWMSKCKLDGAPLRVLDAENAALLASYSADEGFVPGPPDAGEETFEEVKARAEAFLAEQERAVQERGER